MQRPISKVLLFASFCTFFSHIWTASSDVENALKLSRAIKNPIVLAPLTINTPIDTLQDLQEYITGFNEINSSAGLIDQNRLHAWSINFDYTEYGMDSYGYAFLQDTWHKISTPFANGQGVAAQIPVSVQTAMVQAFNNGKISISLVAYDASGNYVSDLTKSTVTTMVLYIFDQNGSIIENPISFSANNIVGLTSGQVTFTDNTILIEDFKFDLEHNSTYPFVWTIINPAGTSVTNQAATQTTVQASTAQQESQSVTKNLEIPSYVENALKLSRAFYNDSLGSLTAKTSINTLQDLRKKYVPLKNVMIQSASWGSNPATNIPMWNWNINNGVIPGQYGYAFIKDPWYNVTSLYDINTKQGVAADLSSVKSAMLKAFNAGGLSLSLLAIDANDKVLLDLTQTPPVTMHLYIFDELGNAIPGTPIIFSAENIVATSPTFVNNKFQMSGLGIPSVITLTYPFELRIKNSFVKKNLLLPSTLKKVVKKSQANTQKTIQAGTTSQAVSFDIPSNLTPFAQDYFGNVADSKYTVQYYFDESNSKSIDWASRDLLIFVTTNNSFIVDSNYTNVIVVPIGKKIYDISFTLNGRKTPTSMASSWNDFISKLNVQLEKLKSTEVIVLSIDENANVNGYIVSNSDLEKGASSGSSPMKPVASSVVKNSGNSTSNQSKTSTSSSASTPSSGTNYDSGNNEEDVDQALGITPAM